MSKKILLVMGILIFGKLVPVIMVALIFLGLGVIIKATIEEGKEL